MFASDRALILPSSTGVQISGGLHILIAVPYWLWAKQAMPLLVVSPRHDVEAGCPIEKGSEGDEQTIVIQLTAPQLWKQCRQTCGLVGFNAFLCGTPPMAK
eukprot:4319018-Amphidinium_carterae.1